MASAQRTLSQRHLYLPWLSAVLNPASMCAIIPLPPHSLHTGSSLIPLLWRFIDDGTILYTDSSTKEMQKGSSLQSSGHVIFRFGRAHFIQTRDPSSTALDLLLSSSSCQTSAWIMSVLCFSPLQEVGGSESLPPYAQVPDDVLQRAFSLCQSYVSCPFVS